MQAAYATAPLDPDPVSDNGVVEVVVPIFARPVLDEPPPQPEASNDKVINAATRVAIGAASLAAAPGLLCGREGQSADELPDHRGVEPALARGLGSSEEGRVYIETLAVRQPYVEVPVADDRVRESWDAVRAHARREAEHSLLQRGLLLHCQAPASCARPARALSCCVRWLVRVDARADVYGAVAVRIREVPDTVRAHARRVTQAASRP
jgi:hypothetical protein